MSRRRNTAHEKWQRRQLEHDGHLYQWTVNGDLIIAIFRDGAPLHPPDGRDALRRAGHEDGELRALHDP